MRNKITRKRCVLLNHYRKSKTYDQDSIKNNFSRCLNELEKNDPLFFELLFNFENKNLSKEDLQKFRKQLADFKINNIFKEKHQNILKKYINKNYDFLIIDSLLKESWQTLYRQNIQKEFLNELSEKKKFELYYFHRNIYTEYKIQESLLILIKYLIREVSSIYDCI